MKDKEWLVEELDEIVEFDLDHRFGLMSDQYVSLNKVIKLVSQLEEPITMSEEFLRANSNFVKLPEGEISRAITVDVLRNVLVPKLDLPEIPQFVADWIKKNKNKYNIKTALGNIDAQEDEICDWVLYNLDTFVRAWLDGYAIEKKQTSWVVRFEAGDFYPSIDEVGYFKEFIKSEALKIKPNGSTRKNDETVYRFTEKDKADAVALLIGGIVEEV